MPQHGQVTGRRGIPLRLALIVAVGILASSCTTSPDASDGGPNPTSVIAANARLACERYFVLDAFRRTEAADAIARGAQARVQALREYRDLAVAMSSAIDSAVIVGDLPDVVGVRSQRVVKELRRLLVAGGDASDLDGPLATRLDRRLGRIEAACAAAGLPLPRANAEIREG